jgi:hypothetical protein
LPARPTRSLSHTGCVTERTAEYSSGVDNEVSERSMIDFDLWRQLTVEHLIGESRGGPAKTLTISKCLS